MENKGRSILSRILFLRKKLAKYDYISSKLAEAQAKDVVHGTNENVIAVYYKYTDIIKQRDAWREEINALEVQIDELKGS